MIAAIITGAIRAGGLLKAFATSKFGQVVIALVVIAVGLLALYNAGFASGRKAGRAEVTATIEQPITGWKARLATCQESSDVLLGSIDTQNAAIEALRKDGDARLAEADKALTRAQNGRAAAEAKVAAIMKPLVAVDSCARVYEADQRLLESLKP